MIIRDSWGTGTLCRIGHRLCISHEIITNFSAPIYQEGFRSDSWSNIIIHITGDVTYSTSDHTYTPGTLDIFTIDAEEPYRIDWGRTQVYERFTIYFVNSILMDIFPYESDHKLILSFLNHIRTPNLLRLSEDQKDELTSALNEIDPKLGAEDINARMSVFNLIMKMFQICYRAGNAVSNFPSSPPKNIVSKALEYINSHYKEITELGVISENLFVSAEYLSKKFKAAMGMSLKSYLLDKKLNYSRHLILLGYNVTEASTAAGFSSTSYFTQIYKRKFGITPSKEINCGYETPFHKEIK